MPDLSGVRVLVTRPAHQAENLARLIEAAGGSAVRFPAVEIADPPDTARLRALIARLHEFDLAIFISPNAVNKALNLIKAEREWPANVAIASVGKGSAREIRHFGLEATLVPAGRFDSEALLALRALQQVSGKRIVIFRGEGGRELLGDTLAARGARVEYAECYRRVRPDADVTSLLHTWGRGGIDVVTLTSVEGLRNLFDLLGKLGQQWLVRTPVVVVSERLAQACHELGFKQAPVVAQAASDEAIVDALLAWRATQKTL